MLVSDQSGYTYNPQNIASNDPCLTLSEIELVASQLRIYISTGEDLRNPTTLHAFALGEV